MRGIDREENASPQKKGQIVRLEIAWGRASQRNLSKSSDRTESLTKAATKLQYNENRASQRNLKKAEAMSGQCRHVAT